MLAKQRQTFNAERDRLMALMSPPSRFEGPMLAAGPMPDSAVSDD